MYFKLLSYSSSFVTICISFLLHYLIICHPLDCHLLRDCLLKLGSVVLNNFIGCVFNLDPMEQLKATTFSYFFSIIVVCLFFLYILSRYILGIFRGRDRLGFSPVRFCTRWIGLTSLLLLFAISLMSYWSYVFRILLITLIFFLSCACGLCIFLLLCYGLLSPSLYSYLFFLLLSILLIRYLLF